MDERPMTVSGGALEGATADPASLQPGPWVPRSMLLAGGLIAALIVVALVAVLIRPTGPTTYPDGSPEAAFQAYMSAYDAEDVEAAYGWFSSPVKDSLP